HPHGPGSLPVRGSMQMEKLQGNEQITSLDTNVKKGCEFYKWEPQSPWGRSHRERKKMEGTENLISKPGPWDAKMRT
ncbi:hypothetical protein HispidOSU_019355, partial [Sigmodon hispidus]